MNERAIFLQALEFPDQTQRNAYLDRACAEDAQLRRQLDELLFSHEQAEEFLERPPELVATITGSTDDTVSEVLLSILRPCEREGSLGGLGKYEIVEVIGYGGMGIVVRAYDPKLGRIVAIKIMNPELAVNSQAVKRFLREARAAAAVTHPHVVTIHAIEEDSRPPFIVMECVDGRSLQEKIECSGPLDFAEVVRLGAQMARGLSAAHAQGMVHRDVKPANILLEVGGERVKLTDFGLARAIDDIGVTKTGQIVGTPQYMSPEQAQGLPVDHRSDLFSLGSVLYTMCTGTPPFSSENSVAVLRQICDADYPSIAELNELIPAEFEEVVARLLEKDPDDRLQSAEELAQLLESCQSDGIESLAQVSSSRRKNGGSRGKAWCCCCALLAVLLFAAGICLWAYRAEKLAKDNEVSTIPLASIAHYFSFDRDTNDSIGGVRGTLVGSARIVPESKSGKGSLQIVSQRGLNAVKADGLADLLARKDFAVSLWVKPAKANHDKPWARSLAAESKSASLTIGIRSDRQDAFGATIRGRPTRIGQWSHLVLSRNKGEYAFFVNGRQVGRRPLDGTRWDHVTIGGLRDGSRDQDGLIDELTLFSTPLSTGQVKTLYEQPDVIARITNASR